MPRYIAFRSFLIATLVFCVAGVAQGARVALDPQIVIEGPHRGPLPGSNTVTAFPTVPAPDPVVQWMVDQVEQDAVRQYAGDLTGEWPVRVLTETVTITTRNTYSQQPIQYATKFVGEHLAALGLDVEYHQWGPATAPNVIGQKTGAARPGDIYMITAHLDDMPINATAPGADDNASGSTGVLVAADILAQFNWNCTLRFAFWTGEEQGLLGSDKYAQRAKGKAENIIGVLNLDMIGWNTPGSPRDIDLHAKGSMPATVELANQTASVVTAYGLNLIPEVRADGTGASDHASFWKYGYNAILGIEDYYPGNHDFDPYYHTPGDRLSTLDLSYFTAYVKTAVAETAHMAGCLTTGTVQGRVTASHDGSSIPTAELGLADLKGRLYALDAGTDGRYVQGAPPGAYSATASAYGYGSSTVSGLQVVTNTVSSQDFVLAALAPAATAATVTLDAGEVRLTWPHLSPNTGYQVHRSTNPYFSPDALSKVATLDANHPPEINETLTYRDGASGVGNTATNHFYVVLATNAAGMGAPSNTIGEFDFALVASHTGNFLPIVNP